eukprot:c20525_g1_i1 orf=734-2614(+)
MNAFGMLGSYFSQGVYAVAGPFQGAVDIIVVQQEDGSFKSSPWYVKCGDFQGVLKRREKIVDISVNGVPADFYMLLNSRGEAYFEKEVEDAVLALPSTSSSSEGIEENRKLEGLGSSTSVASKEVSQVQQKGTADANGSTRGEGSQGQQKGSADACGSTRGDCMDRIRGRTDDLVSTCPSQVREPLSAVDQSSGSSIDQLSGPSIHQASAQQKLKDKEYARKSAAHSRDTSRLNATDLSDSHFDTSEETSELRDPPGCHVEGKPMVINVSGENLILEQLADEERPQLQRVSNVQSDVQTGKDGDGPGLLVQDDDVLNLNPSSSVTGDAVVCTLNTMITEEWFGLQKALSFESGDDSTCTQNDLETSDVKAMDELIWNDFKIVTAEEEIELHDALNTASILGLRLDGDTWKSDTADGKVSEQVDSSVWVSDALVDDATSNIAVAITENSILMQEEKGGNASTDNITLDKDVVCKVEEGPPAEGNKAAEIPTIAVGPPPSRWTMWPLSFRRSRRAEEAPASEAAAATRQALLAATNIAVGSPLTGEILRKNGYYEWAPKPKLRSYVPTSAQIESLKLKDGPNKVTFTFPRVLGRTQVDASIYLWKWNTRIVISDVDGTITKSDVLGQF